MTLNQLTYFTAVGHWYDVEAPDTSSTTNTPVFEVISAFVTFTPRLKPGTVPYVANLDLGAVASPPGNLAVTPSATGGTLTSGVKYWVITATTANGETTPSNEVSATLTGSASSAALSWPVVHGATGYKIYRGTTAATENTLVATINSGNTLTYTDTGNAGTAATPPATNTAELSANTAVPIAAETGRILNGELETINIASTPGVQLLANTAVLGLTSLIYDVSFTNVVYAATTQTLTNFAFTAPTTNTTIDLTDPALTRLAYDPTNYS
jgi:hypothetical protein